MSLQLSYTRASLQEKPILASLLQLYLYDFSEMEGWDCNEQGIFDYPYFDEYWIAENRTPYLLRYQEKFCGFCLINEYSERGSQGIIALAEFFIMRKYRQNGLGFQFATQIIKNIAGSWEIAVNYSNPDARKFWHKVVRSLVKEDFIEQDIPEREKWVLCFISFP